MVYLIYYFHKHILARIFPAISKIAPMFVADSPVALIFVEKRDGGIRDSTLAGTAQGVFQ